MSDSTPKFRIVMRGYEPAQVDHYLAELGRAFSEADHYAAEAAEQIEDLNSILEEQRAKIIGLQNTAATAQGLPTYEHLGARVGQILALAEQEANEISAAATADADQRLALLDDQNAELRREAEEYAEGVRALADSNAVLANETSQRTAELYLQEAEHQALIRQAEAEAIVDQQRAEAAKAAADFEQTLALRRDTAERELAERAAADERKNVEAQENILRLQTEAQELHAQAQRQAELLGQESASRAERLISEATAHAARIREESERDLANAIQRRDSIHAQLVTVRGLLATLGSDVLGEPDEVTAPASAAPARKTPRDAAVKTPKATDRDVLAEIDAEVARAGR